MKPCAALLAAIALFGHSNAYSDEGMWLFNHPPLQILKDRYQFEPSAGWFEHIQKASVRFNNGGSGSFVSSNGLIITNHHIGFDTLQKLSDAKHDYVRNGFLAHSPAEEKRALDLELNVLISIEDVTQRVNAAIQPGMNADAAFAARRAVMAQIESESLQKTGLRSDVVELYGGSQCHLYRYKRYTDVRLVFAPEQQAAFFGGDPDNFEYPRYDLDVCFFRAYENGHPAKVEHYLKWSTQGVSENDLVFVSGNPGHTSRQLITAELEYMRDERLPHLLRRLYRKEAVLSAWGARNDENGRRVKEALFGIANGRKVQEGRLAGLLDPSLMNDKEQAEAKLRQVVDASPIYRDAASAWDQIQAAQQVIAKHATATMLLEWGQGFDSTLFGIGRTLLRAADEKAKPNGDRLREFRDSNRQSLELGLFSPEPIYSDVEILNLSDSLTWLAVQLGASNSLVRQVLAGKSPHERAVELVSGTKLADIEFRKRLYSESAQEIAAVHDPMIELARLVDPESRRLRKIDEAQDEIKRQRYAKIRAAKFAMEGGTSYPDATFTLRLAFGTVRGYQQDGAPIPFQTTFAGLYQRAEEHHNQPPFNLTPRWLERKKQIDLSTPFNFVCTADIIGGNSGSPVINRAGEFVGIIFDGNIQSLVSDFAYTDKQARAVSVNSQAILEALRKIYGAQALTAELTGK